MGVDPAARSQLDNVAKNLVVTWSSSARQDGEISRTARDCFEGAVAIRYNLADVQPLHFVDVLQGYVGHHYMTLCHIDESRRCFFGMIVSLILCGVLTVCQCVLELSSSLRSMISSSNGQSPSSTLTHPWLVKQHAAGHFALKNGWTGETACHAPWCPISEKVFQHICLLIHLISIAQTSFVY